MSNIRQKEIIKQMKELNVRGYIEIEDEYNWFASNTCSRLSKDGKLFIRDVVNNQIIIKRLK